MIFVQKFNVICEILANFLSKHGRKKLFFKNGFQTFLLKLHQEFNLSQKMHF
jgi:hypothetical protein